MLTCKQVSNALSREDYEQLSPWRRFFLRCHIKLCLFCGKFNQQVIDSQEMCRCYKEKEDSLAEQRPKLDPQQKDQLKALLSQQLKK